MATETVMVTVHCKKNGKLSIDVGNWEVKGKVSAKDELQWECKANPDAGEVKWIRIENPFSAANWPFKATPPDPTYIGKPGYPAKSGPLKDGWKTSKTPIRYGITVCFADDADPTAERYAYIDPDMVFD